MRLMAFSRASRFMSDVGTICVMPSLLNNAVGSFNQNAVMMRLRVYIQIELLFIY